MATTAAGGTPTRVSWLLLASYAVLLGVGGLGVWVSVINFWQEEALPPTPPPENTTTTTTTTTTPATGRRQYYYKTTSRSRVEVPQAYKDYVSQSVAFARIADDERFYVAPLCLVSVVVAGLTLVAGLFSRRLFSSTFSLYSSLVLWILTLVMTVSYQSILARSSELPFNPYKTGWVVGCHIFLLLFLPLQMLLCMWELRRQKTKGWPTINFLNVFTLEALLLVPRLCLTVFAFDALSESQIFQGFEGEQDPRYKDHLNCYYFCKVPRIRYPLECSLLICAATSYSAVATLETTLSMLLGKLHHRMTTLTCLLSGLCCVTVAIFSSPAFIRGLIGPYNMYPSTVSLTISLSVVTLLHWLACLFIPSTLRAPPSVLTQTVGRLLQAISLDNITAIVKTEGRRGMELFPKKVKHDRNIKAASLIFSIISLAITGISAANTPSDWGHIMVLSVNAMTVIQTLPPLLLEFFLEEKERIPVKQRLIGLALVIPVLFVGSIGMCTSAWDGLGIFAGVMNIFYSAFQGLVMCCLLKKLSQDQHSDDTKDLIPAEEATSQGDDENNPTDAMA